MTWSLETSLGFESDKIKHLVVPYTRGRGLDLGCGNQKVWPNAIGVDNGHHFGQGGAEVMVETCEKLDLFADESMDFVFSSHLLEHIVDTESALKEWWRVIKVGGHLCLYLPHRNFYPNIGQPGANPDHKHDFVPADILAAMTNVAPSWNCVVDEERNEGNEYSFWQVYRKTDDGVTNVTAYVKPKKTACICRFGGVGDQLQMSSILPGLQKQGFHITVMTTPSGQAVLKEDPNIDAWIIQDTDQVPNEELGDYWAAWSQRFDKFINLSEATEVAALAYPGKMPYSWPDQARRNYYGRINYLELLHSIAEAPGKPAVHFYPSETEREWAVKQKAVFGERPVIVWSLSGSSYHKAYPHTDAVVAKLMIETDAAVVFVGDLACQILESGWESEPRVMCTSGEWSIRQTLAFAQVADVVIGPETGVMSAVGFERDVRSIVLLSHSSKFNLCEGWQNYDALAPEKTPCYPCHKMHVCPSTCNEDAETGAALCAARISPEAVFNAIAKGIKRMKRAA